MAQNNELLQDWATGVWQDLGSPSNIAVTTISGYAVQPSTLGRLNDLIETCFSGSGYVGVGTANYQIGPWITNRELAIIGQLYLVSYYNNLAQANMGIGGNGIPWILLKEGDSTIGRVNAANLGNEYREMSKSAYEQLWNLVNAFRNSEGGSLARSVDYYNPPTSPYNYGYGPNWA
jgi:hypothetical protein